ncbi:MAG: hypothetical protein A3A58_03520 [Candidatus Blackburnbacteria bacterium RIFCSPLOWO2_01_FULL_41_27]|uniref:Transglycosylase SLT domain-containing protein n=1 Tax=Candidatus Blackburnbacteria bacterium RIFCSPLOWO2_01_FULL_41_27 TaxID=1797520 RepID=A0A1G1VE40_9BACT|nr:MAG: hypothetical protein A3A58_03520 [Candidatus Blackburnbacteria bacterium RIFCSPLOWO2_01_FULL_41_27]
MFRFLLLFSLILFSFPSTSKAQVADPALCPEGYTCPDTSFKPVPGKEIPVEKKGFFGISLPSFSGDTGPSKDQLRSPDYSREEEFFMDSEIISRSLPYEVIKEGLPEFKPDNLKGTLSHPGCGKVSVKNNEGNTTTKGDTRIEQGRAELIPLTSSYNQLLLGFRFWEAQSSGDKPAKLRFKSIQPSGNPTLSENSGDCVNEGGESYGEATTLTNPAPASAGLLGNLASEIGKFISGLLDKAGATATATFSVQQTKIFPGEEAFAKQSNNFLNSFLPFEDAQKMIDQEEAVSYRAIGEGKVVGVPFEGAKSTQNKTVDLVKSLRPYEEAKLITTLGPTGGLQEVKPPTPGLNYTIPYNNPDAVRLTPEIKNKIIEMVKNSWPNTKIAEQWDIVASTSYASGINPAFAIALWIEESGASHYNNHFSCPPSESDFQKSFNCFINTTNNIQPPDWARWVRNYCGTPENQPICKNDSNGNFIDGLESWYKKIVPPGSPGAATPL